MHRQLSRRPLVIGLVVGLIFGFADIVQTWLNPTEDDSPIAVLRFYGPMFLTWTVVSCRTARGTGRWWSGTASGMVVAFATFAAFIVLNFLRVNLFLDELTGRPDWQNMMARFRTSGFEDLRLFVNFVYLTEVPLKIAAATAFGAVFGALGGTLGWVTHARATLRTT
jgi:hypothetical protein